LSARSPQSNGFLVSLQRIVIIRNFKHLQKQTNAATQFEHKIEQTLPKSHVRNVESIGYEGAVGGLGATEDLVVLAPGQVLFEQGDPGGDLFFIQSGEVQIYRTSDLHEVTLATMVTGEIIGIMTCMSNEPRMASARAVTDAVVKRVRHENIQKLMGDLPPWMKIVMKDFTNRLAQMNKSYSVSILEVRELKVNQITKLYTATQIASCLANLAPLIKVSIDEVPGVFLEDAAEKIQDFLNRPKEEVVEILDIFADAGIIRIEKDAERKRNFTTVANCESLRNFTAWVRQSKSGATKKLLAVNFSNKEARVLSGLVKFARKMNLNLKGNVSINLSDLEKSLEKAVGQKFEVEALEQASKHKLLSLQGADETRKVTFVPIELSRTMAHLTAYKKLMQLQLKSESSGTKSSQAA
jgi:CRP-like cAMP-binding protein